MELFKELFVTAFIALVFSFLVAKLVSIVMSPDHPSSSAAVRDADVNESEQEDLRAADKLQVHRAKSEEVTATLEKSSERVRFEEFLPEVEGETSAPAPETEVEEEEAVDDRAVVEDAGVEEGDPRREVEIEDDWEGIERSEVEEAFGKAARLVESREEDERLAGDGFGLELYGLHKVATEGPCHENPPLALKLSARSKWNAWQKLGNMTPEAAMEKYVELVSERVPGWMDEKTNSDSEARSSGAGASLLGLDSSAVSSTEINVIKERNAETKPDLVGNDLTEALSSESRSENEKETPLAAA